MGYLLVDPLILEEKGIKYFERIPDGRGIVDFGMLRVLGSVSNVQIVGSKEELDEIIKEQKNSGVYDTPTILPELGSEPVGGEPVDEGFLRPEVSEDEHTENEEAHEDGITKTEIIEKEGGE